MARETKLVRDEAYEEMGSSYQCVQVAALDSALQEHGMSSNSELFSVLDGLVDGWCERRALRPLGILLRVYPMASPLSDGWQELRGALRNLRCLREPEVSESEAVAIEDSLRAVETALGIRSRW